MVHQLLGESDPILGESEPLFTFGHLIESEPIRLSDNLTVFISFEARDTIMQGEHALQHTLNELLLQPIGVIPSTMLS